MGGATARARVAPWWRLAIIPAWLLLSPSMIVGCTTGLERGERAYRGGDRLAALEIWRSVPRDATNYRRVRDRIEVVEKEFDALVVRYKKRGRYYEGKDRLAESILNYRLALRLQPDDRETLDHVQSLARTLAERKAARGAALQAALDQGELGQARRELAALRRLDPFEAELETVERQLDEALGSEVERLLARGRRGFTTGHYQRARKAFESVLELDPENDSARGYLSYMTTIRAEEARPGGRVAGFPPQLDASEPQIRAEGHYQNALAAERSGDPYASIEHDVRALRLDPTHAGAGRHLAELRRQLGPEVTRLIEEGRAHFQAEELQSALDDWRRALLIDPNNAQAREYTARAELLLQNLEQLRAEPASSTGGS